MSKSVNRLFRIFQPDHYDIELELNDKSATFNGKVIIGGIKVGRPSKRLVFHQKGLQITQARIRVTDKKGTKQIEIARIVHHHSLHEVRLHTNDTLYAANYEVTLEFRGKITESLTGIYPAHYQYKGVDQQLLMTQFESHHAREAIPCIDEPEAKATFRLKLYTPDKKTVLSNTPAISTVKIHRKDKVYFETEFEQTPKMSSYLLAFIYGELQCLETSTSNHTSIRIWSTPSQPKESMRFGLEVAKNAIEFFESYFNTPYPLKKIDHVAVPDFSSGAMENWGLVTYRERVLLAYPGQTSQSVEELIATVIAHETSHQWFGNLVTMRWWDDLWLNESFADLMEYIAVDQMFPHWHVWDSFINHEGLAALRRDAINGVQPVKSKVHHPDEINSLFDPAIVYAKGGRLLYMLKNLIGESAFRLGLENYFKKFAYNNTTGDDLWNELTASSKINVKQFMGPWLDQSGFPVVTITQKGQMVNISQQHFSEDITKSDKSKLWPVPLFTSTKILPPRLDTSQLSISLDHTDYVYINEHAFGHYLVNYESEDQLVGRIKAISRLNDCASERLMLLNYGSMLSKAGYSVYGKLLTILKYFSAEKNESVWDMISLVVAETRRFTYLEEKLEKKLKMFVYNLIADEYARLGWEQKANETPNQIKLRATIIGLALYGETKEVVESALNLFRSFMENEGEVSPELRPLVFTAAIKNNYAGAFTYLLEMHDKTPNSDMKSDLAAGLTSTRLIAQAKTLLDRLTDTKKVKPQDLAQWLIYLLGNKYSRDTAWDWLEANWGWIEDKFKFDKSYDEFPRYAATCCNTTEHLERYQRFFAPKQSDIALRRNILVAIEEITNRVNWLERDLRSVKLFFTNDVLNTP